MGYVPCIVTSGGLLMVRKGQMPASLSNVKCHFQEGTKPQLGVCMIALTTRGMDSHRHWAHSCSMSTQRK